MKFNQLNETRERSVRALASARGWLRRVMPRIALVCSALFALWLFLNKTSLYRGTLVKLLGPLTFLSVAVVIAYYGLKSLVRLKNLLLWRVRRRLLVTYLFVGLTPIVLLLVLGFFVAMNDSKQGMARILTVQLNTAERQTLENTLSLADALARLPASMTDRQTQAWLDERVVLLQATLPGARVSAWRGANDADAATLGERTPPQFASAPPLDENTRGVGEEEMDAASSSLLLPAWLRGRAGWGGLSYTSPPRTPSGIGFGAPAIRAMSREVVNSRAVTVLVTVPVSRALITRLREETDIYVRPYFLISQIREQDETTRSDTGSEANGEEPGVKIDLSEDDRAAKDKRLQMGVDFIRDQHDQFGEKLPGGFFNWYPILLPATDWTNGQEATRWAFIIDWSWAASAKQFRSNLIGEILWKALAITGLVFLVLEVLALLSAAWMTRAVTGTVHKLYQATEFIKRGDFSHRIRTRSRDQLGELALAFNDMSSNIETLLQERVEHERLEREVEIAAEVQAQLFPRSVPQLVGVEMTGECRAARGVAGDYYDYITVAPGLVLFALGDVSGKGISAALVMSNLQASLRAQVTIIAERLKFAAQTTAQTEAAVTTTMSAGVGHAGVTSIAATSTGGDGVVLMPCGVTGTDTQCAVSNIAASINGQLCHSTDANRFATLFLALYDERTRTLRYTNAGHNWAILVRSGGAIERLSAGGMMVGAFDWAEYEEAQTTLDAGDLLLVFSDGLTEAQDGTGEEYGEERLTQFVSARHRHTAEELRAAIFDEVNQWSGAAERTDDQTLVIVKAIIGESH